MKLVLQFQLLFLAYLVHHEARERRDKRKYGDGYEESGGVVRTGQAQLGMGLWNGRKDHLAHAIEDPVKRKHHEGLAYSVGRMELPVLPNAQVSRLFEGRSALAVEAPILPKGAGRSPSKDRVG